MRQALLFVAGMAALFLVVPVAILCATGRWQAAWVAAKGYALFWALLLACMAAGALVGMAAGFMPS